LSWKARSVIFIHHPFYNADFHFLLQEEERKGGKKGRLLGVITLSDVLRYVIGNSDIGEGVEPEEELKSPTH
jgi:CBS domain-containing protein